jgi:hypothetical protein
VQRTPSYKEHWKVITDRDPTADELRALQLAWKVCKHTRSNTIIFADKIRTLGIGAGQMSRVDAAKIAIQKACAPLTGSSVASDAFLPFPDTLEVAAKAGATALVQQTGFTWQWFLRAYGTSGINPDNVRTYLLICAFFSNQKKIILPDSLQCLRQWGL